MGFDVIAHGLDSAPYNGPTPSDKKHGTARHRKGTVAGTDVGGPETARAHESARVDHLFYYTAPDLLLHAFLPTMIKLQLTLTKQIFPRPKGQFWVEDSVVLAQNCLELENGRECSIATA